MHDSWLDLCPQKLLRVSSSLNFPEILIGLIWSRDAIVFIREEIVSVHSDRPSKIPGWIAVVRRKTKQTGL